MGKLAAGRMQGGSGLGLSTLPPAPLAVWLTGQKLTEELVWGSPGL